MKQRKKSFGMKISAFVLSFAMVCTLLAGVNVVAFAADDLDSSVNVMRFNSTMTGEHIFTANDGEINYYNGMQPVWQNEGVAWKAPLYSETGVYRIFNNLTFEHMWTTDAFEVFINTTYGPWTLEQDPAFYSDDNMGVPVYRLSKKGYEGYGAHHYTVDETERFWLLASGEWNDEGVAFYGVKEEEPQEFEINAVQTGSDEVTITSDTKLSDDDEFTLMRGTTVVGVTADVDESGMSATLYTDETIIAADYTVVVTKADESTATDTFTGEVSKLSAISFVDDKLILADTSYKNGMVAIRGFNQFGEPEILDNNLKLYSSVGTATYKDPDNGIVMVSQAASGSSVFVVGSPVVVTAVYQKGTTVLQTTGTLTVAAQKAIQSFEFGDVQTTVPSYQGLPITHAGLASGTYYVPVEAIDQYGNELTAGELNAMAKQGTLLVTPNDKPSAFAYVDAKAGETCEAFDTLEDGTVIAWLDDGEQKIPGTAVITMVSVGGTSGMTSFEISDNRYIAELDVTIPTLYSGVRTEFEINAVDQYGIELSDEDLYKIGAVANKNTLTFKDQNALTGNGSSITSSEEAGVFKVVTNAAKKTLKVFYTPKKYNDKDGLELFTVTSAKPSVEVKNVTVKALATPTGIKGLPDGTSTVVRKDQGATVNLGAVQFTDSYGNVYLGQDGLVNYSPTEPTKNNDTGYYYTITAPTSNQKTTIAHPDDYNHIVSGTAKSGAAIGVDKYTISLYKVVKGTSAEKLATKQISITNSDGDFVAYTAGLATGMGEIKSKLYNGVVSSTSPATIQVAKFGKPADFAVVGAYGIDASGNVVPLAAGNYTVALRDDYVAGSKLTATNAGPYWTITTAKSDYDEVVSEEAIVDVFVGGQIVASPTIEVSNEAPTALGFVGYRLVGSNLVPIDPSEGIDLNGAAGDITTNLVKLNKVPNAGVFALGNKLGDAYVVFAVDQYGMSYVNSGVNAGTEIDATPNVTKATTITLAAGNQTVVIPITVSE